MCLVFAAKTLVGVIEMFKAVDRSSDVLADMREALVEMFGAPCLSKSTLRYAPAGARSGRS